MEKENIFYGTVVCGTFREERQRENLFSWASSSLFAEEKGIDAVRKKKDKNFNQVTKARNKKDTSRRLCKFSSFSGCHKPSLVKETGLGLEKNKNVLKHCT